jgi:hypothetical protein
MGGGVAKQLRNKYPQIFDDFLEVIEDSIDVSSSVALGLVAKTKISDSLWIFSGITQRYYGNDGQRYVDYDAIEDVFYIAAHFANRLNLEIHVPYLIGAGLGGGNEKIILDIIEKAMYNSVCNFHHYP